MKRVLITGGCGFIGSSCAIDLALRGYAVTVLDNLSRRGSEFLRAVVEAQGIDFVLGDIRQPGDLARLSGEFSLMIECSAEPSAFAAMQGKDARHLLDVNLLGAINCFEWAREHGVPVLFLSSSRVYPHDRINSCQYKESEDRFNLAADAPGIGSQGIQLDMPLQGVRSLYGASKLSAEMILQEYAFLYKLPSIIDRCGVIAGPGQLGRSDQGFFTYWLAGHYFKRPLQYMGFGGLGKQVRDLLHIQDLVRLLAEQAECLIKRPAEFQGKIFNVGGAIERTLSLKEATAICAELTGHTLRIGSVPGTRPGDVIWQVMDNCETSRFFHWQPQIPVQGILEDTYRWLRDNEKNLKDIIV